MDQANGCLMSVPRYDSFGEDAVEDWIEFVSDDVENELVLIEA
jgi:hypothetical protein